MNDDLSSDLASLRIDRTATGRTSGKAVRWVLGFAVAAVACVAAWKVAEPALAANFFKTEVTLTEIALVSPAQATVRLTSTGYVVPQVQVDVSSKIMGRVLHTDVREGQNVKRGDRLFELDPNDQRVAIASAQARVAAARARAAGAKAQLAEVVLQRDRERRLADTGAVAAATADDLTARARSLEEQVHAAEADVGASLAEVGVLSENLANGTIRSPIDGTVMTKPLLPGDVVSPGTSMAKMADPASIVVETDVPETRLALVAPGRPCEIVLDAYPDKRWRGEVVEISPQLNRAKATATVKVRFLDRDASVLPEMAARVSFLDAPLEVSKLSEPPKKVVPGAAVVDRSGVRGVFVAEAGKVRLAPVTLGKPFGDGFELVDGPSPGTKIVANPPVALSDGQAIKERNM